MQKIIVANWKMYGSSSMAKMFENDFLLEKTEDYQYIFCPPFTLLKEFHNIIQSKDIFLGAQNCSSQKNGALTGEISAEMLKDMDCRYCLIGHSERRQNFQESQNDLLREKLKRLHEENLIPIFCIGETEDQHQHKKTKEILANQLEAAKGLQNEILIAYEPIWAIGTNKTPSPQDIENVHRYIKSLSPPNQKVLYGGSVNPENAAPILSNSYIDGILVGRASLTAKSLLALKS